MQHINELRSWITQRTDRNEFCANPQLDAQFVAGFTAAVDDMAVVADKAPAEILAAVEQRLVEHRAARSLPLTGREQNAAWWYAGGYTDAVDKFTRNFTDQELGWE